MMVAEDERDQKARGDDLRDVAGDPISAEKPRASVLPDARIAAIAYLRRLLRTIFGATVPSTRPSTSHV